MRTQHKRPLSLIGSVGFSIVELMVAILIGLIILAGVIQVVVTSKTTFLGQEEMSFIQENARYAVDLIGKDVQSAGYMGCAGNVANLAYLPRVNATSSALAGVELVRGFEGDVASTASYPEIYRATVRPIYQPGTTTIKDYPDSFVVHGGGERSVALTGQSGQTFTLAQSPAYAVGEHIVIVAEDCRRASIVRTATVAANQFTVTAASVCSTLVKPQLDENNICSGTCSCSGQGSSELFMPGSVSMPFNTHAYFVAESSVLPGVPALKRSVLRGGDGVTEEIALGVEDMEVLYGVVSGGNLRYMKASEVTDWNSVASVQVSLLMRSQAVSLAQAEARTYLNNTYNDRFMRQVITSTFRLRNRT